jgi:hypothetical protein
MFHMKSRFECVRRLKPHDVCGTSDQRRAHSTCPPFHQFPRSHRQRHSPSRTIPFFGGEKHTKECVMKEREEQEGVHIPPPTSPPHLPIRLHYQRFGIASPSMLSPISLPFLCQCLFWLTLLSFSKASAEQAFELT